MAHGVTPTCRYGHGEMRVVDDPDGPCEYAAVAMIERRLTLGLAYSFHIYECPVCSYLEFHDTEPKRP